MESTNIREMLQVHGADLTDLRFWDVKRMNSLFANVAPRGASFTDVNLSAATFTDVNFANASIEDSNLKGMRINGILLCDPLQTYEQRARGGGG